MAGKRILVADDDSELRNLLKFYLVKQGFEVTVCTNATEALGAVEGGAAFDLLLSDVMMPGMDGYHLAQAFNEKLGKACPKILLMTSRDLDKERGVAMMSGSDDTIQKPFKLADLRARITLLLGV
jgi:DNA-binding response OmpR family regulator